MMTVKKQKQSGRCREVLYHTAVLFKFLINLVFPQYLKANSLHIYNFYYRIENTIMWHNAKTDERA